MFSFLAKSTTGFDIFCATKSDLLGLEKLVFSAKSAHVTAKNKLIATVFLPFIRYILRHIESDMFKGKDD